MSTDLLENSVAVPRADRPVLGRQLALDYQLISSHRGQSRLALSSPARVLCKISQETKSAATRAWLPQGGDSRIVCGLDGRNRYGCSSAPEPDVLAYGSCTASTISPAAFAAADALRQRLEKLTPTPAPEIYESELNRVRREFKMLCELENLSGLDLVFGASGTDLHLFASQLFGKTEAVPTLVIRVEAGETGRGVPEAFAGHHFGDCAPFRSAVLPHATLQGACQPDVLEIKCRTQDGAVRPSAVIDAEVEKAVRHAVADGRRVLLTLVDVSKTGLLVPSPCSVKALRDQFPETIDVLVDACQFRLAPRTLRAYLEDNFIVAITGSKFVTGPTFCGALLVPGSVANRLRHRPIPTGLKAYSARADWPAHWRARASLEPRANFGLLLRWEAALTELRAFRSLNGGQIGRFLEIFAATVTDHFSRHPAFEFVPSPALDRGSFGNRDWDRFPTIFSFLLRRKTAAGKYVFVNQDETKKIHELLYADFSGDPSHPLSARRCQLGQPVPCGTREGKPVSVLRLCASTRLIHDALSPAGRGIKAVLADALTVLDQAALLASLPPG